MKPDTTQKIIFYPFRDAASEQPPTKCRAGQLMEKVNSGGRLNREKKLSDRSC